jgi:hypothetical protein
MTARQLVLLLLVAMAIACCVIPAYRSDTVLWFNPPYHPEYYRDTAFPFAGYSYPILLVLLFVSAAAPHLIGSPRLPGLAGTIGLAWSRFTLLLLGIVSVLFIIWLAITPMF